MKLKELRKLIREEINHLKLEGTLPSPQQQTLNSLIDDFKQATDPDRDSYDSYEGKEPEDIINDIRSQFGDKIASQVEDGKYSFHFGREYPQGGDKLDSKQKWGYHSPRITKGKKMNKQDISKMKNYYKRGY